MIQEHEEQNGCSLGWIRGGHAPESPQKGTFVLVVAATKPARVGAIEPVQLRISGELWKWLSTKEFFIGILSPDMSSRPDTVVKVRQRLAFAYQGPTPILYG